MQHRVTTELSRKFGLHRNVAAVCGKTLAKAHYKIKTMLGVSEEGFSHCQAHPIYGISWNLWKKANYLWTSQGTKLKQPLGRWLVPADKLRRSWKAYLDPTSQELLLRYSDQHYKSHPSHQNSHQRHCDEHNNTLPPTCRPGPLYCRDPKHGQSEQPRLFSSSQNKPNRAKALLKHL